MPGAYIYDANGAPIVLSGGGVPTSLSTLISGEDQTNNALIIRHRTPWTATSAPGAAAQASASKAAGAAGVKHVLRALLVTMATNAAANDLKTLVVRDGATGAGTILWQVDIAVQGIAGSCTVINLNDLWIEGSAAVAFTVEFTAAAAANVRQSIAIQGESIS